MLPDQLAALVAEHGAVRRVGEHDDAVVARHENRLAHALQHARLHGEGFLGSLALADVAGEGGEERLAVLHHPGDRHLDRHLRAARRRDGHLHPLAEE